MIDGDRDPLGLIMTDCCVLPKFLKAELTITKMQSQTAVLPHGHHLPMVFIPLDREFTSLVVERERLPRTERFRTYVNHDFLLW